MRVPKSIKKEGVTCFFLCEKNSNQLQENKSRRVIEYALRFLFWVDDIQSVCYYYPWEMDLHLFSE